MKDPAAIKEYARNHMAKKRAIRKAKGLCIDCAGQTKGLRCPECQAKNNARSTESIQTKAIAGLCVRCGQERGRPGFYCKECNTKHYFKYTKPHRQEWKRLGLCEECGNTKDPEQRLCDSCKRGGK